MSTAWLKDLEERVHQASARIGSLVEEKAGLEQKVAALEGRVGELESALEKATTGAAADATAAWSEEREDIKSRVEALVEHLDGLLES